MKKYFIVILAIATVFWGGKYLLAPAGNSQAFIAQAEIVGMGGKNKIVTALKKNKPVFVMFYTTWCSTCKKSKPIFDALEPQFKDKITFMKIDSERNDSLADEYNVRSIPTAYLIFPSNEKINIYNELFSETHLKNKLNKLLKEKGY